MPRSCIKIHCIYYQRYTLNIWSVSLIAVAVFICLACSLISLCASASSALLRASCNLRWRRASSLAYNKENGKNLDFLVTVPFQCSTWNNVIQIIIFCTSKNTIPVIRLAACHDWMSSLVLHPHSLVYENLGSSATLQHQQIHWHRVAEKITRM